MGHTEVEGRGIIPCWNRDVRVGQEEVKGSAPNHYNKIDNNDRGFFLALT
jgi:hypothetical protein